MTEYKRAKIWTGILYPRKETKKNKQKKKGEMIVESRGSGWAETLTVTQIFSSILH